MSHYIERLIAGNIRLIILALVASTSFFLTEVWRDRIEIQVSHMNANASATEQALQRLLNSEWQLEQSLGIFMPIPASSLSERAEALANGTITLQRLASLGEANIIDEQARRLEGVYFSDIERRNQELNQLALQIGTSSYRPRDMEPIEELTLPAQGDLMEKCQMAFWPDAPPAIKAAILDFQFPAIPAKPTMREQWVLIGQGGMMLQEKMLALNKAVSDERLQLNKPIYESTDPNRTAAPAIAHHLRQQAIYGACIDSLTRLHSGALISLLRYYRLELLERSQPLATQQDRLRYLSYLVAILAFLATNMKPARPVSRLDTSDKPANFA
jgi:hypothetical protein